MLQQTTHTEHLFWGGSELGCIFASSLSKTQIASAASHPSRCCCSFRFGRTARPAPNSEFTARPSCVRCCCCGPTPEMALPAGDALPLPRCAARRTGPRHAGRHGPARHAAGDGPACHIARDDPARHATGDGPARRAAGDGLACQATRRRWPRPLRWWCLEVERSSSLEPVASGRSSVAGLGALFLRLLLENESFAYAMLVPCET